MYVKDLSETVHLRLTKKDMEFLVSLSEERGTTVSEVLRQLVGEYRRAQETLDVLRGALAQTQKGDKDDHGDAKPNIDD